VEVIYLAIGDAIKDVGEPFGWIYIIDFAGSQQGINNSGAFGGFMISTEQIVFPALCWHQIYVGMSY